MKRAINIASLFLFAQLFLSYALSVLPYSRVYVSLTFALPLFLFCLPFVKEAPKAELRTDFRGVLPFLWLFPLFEIAIVLASLATGFASDLVGYIPSPVVPTGSALEIIAFSIILPAIYEEALCRYAILRLLSPYGTQGAVVVSALLFALMHGNFYQMPYAFVAGIALGAITLASRSVMSAVVFHALNNLCSAMLYFSDEREGLIFVCLMMLLSLVGIAMCKKNGILHRLQNVLLDKSAPAMLSATVGSLALLYMVIMVVSAV